MLDIELERRFFEEFVPNVIHPRTGAPLQLYKYQVDSIHKFFAYQINLWEMGRQVGKTSDAGLLLCFLSREIRGDAVISSFRMEQSQDIVQWTKDWCLSHRDSAYAENIDNDAKTEIIFKSGFHVIALPHGHTARGKSTVIVITDESELIDDEDLAALLPTGLTTMPKRLHMGTVWGTSSWWWTFIQNADTRHYALSQQTSEEAILPNGPVIKSQLDLLKQELGDLQYNQECLLLPIPDIDTFFGQALVDACVKDYTHPTLTKDSELVIGFDHAVSGGDESVAHIGILQANGALHEYEVRRWLNTLIHYQVEELGKQYPNARYCIDATAEGGKEALGYFQRAGLDVFPVDFGKSKPTLMITHKNRMQQNLFKFQDEKTRVQHLNYKFQESENKKGSYRYGKKGTPDDRVDAAALADYRAFLLTGYGGAENAALFVGEELKFDSTS